MSVPLIDAHLDLAWSALSWDRDLTLPVPELRQREAELTDDRARGQAMVSLPEMKRARVAVCLGTLLARTLPTEHFAEPRPLGQATMSPKRRLRGVPRRLDLDYGAPSIAHGIACGQLAYYHWLQRQGHLRLIQSRDDLDQHWRAWSADPEHEPIGLILAMEGADPITAPEELAWWAQAGLRVLAPVHYGQNRYAVGTGFDGPLTDAGRALLRAMSAAGTILDVTHLSDTSMAEALDLFEGPVIASHHNCRALVPHHRQLSDEQIRRLIDRGAVIGTALDAWMLRPGWVHGQSKPEQVGLDAVADHIDHVCQLAGNTRHAALGSDLDGGFGVGQTPRELDTIADVQKLGPLLRDRGYSDQDIAAIFHANWLGLLRTAL